MCISLPTVEAALHSLFGLTPSFGVEIAILIVSACIAGCSVWMGLDKGIKRLSDLNVIIALAMVVYGAVCGPTAGLFDIFTNAVGKWLGNYWNMTFWTSPFNESTFPKDWTIFYALFWAGYGPFMGLFIAPHLARPYSEGNHRLGYGRLLRRGLPHSWGIRLLYPVYPVPRHT